MQPISQTSLMLKGIKLDTATFKFLKSAPHEKFSRIEAYYDLIRMALETDRHIEKFGQKYDLLPGEIIVTYSDLSKKWNWSRNTIASFLDKLQELGQLSIIGKIKCYQIEMLALAITAAQEGVENENPDVVGQSETGKPEKKQTDKKA